MRGSIKKRGKSWCLIVDIGKDPVTGKRRQKSKGGFVRKKDAEDALTKILVELGNNNYVAPSKEVFASFIEEWFTGQYLKRIGETTAVSIRALINKHLIRENHFAHKSLAEITTEDIDMFYNDKIDEGYNPNYVRKMHSMLKQAFGQAVKWKRLSYNPVIDATPPVSKKEEMKIWNPKEIQIFLQYCKVKAARHFITFLLAIYTGMRRGEILGLKWSDIDLEKKKISVKRSLAYIPEKGYIFTNLKTNSSKREILIPEFLVDELSMHKIQQQMWKEQYKESYQDLEFVICDKKGLEQDARGILKVMNRLTIASSVTKIRFHDLRHTHASILIAEGVDIVKVAHRLGHTNPKITLETYSHLIPEEENEVAEIFHSALNPCVSKL